MVVRVSHMYLDEGNSDSSHLDLMAHDLSPDTDCFRFKFKTPLPPKRQRGGGEKALLLDYFRYGPDAGYNF